jgi:hypothetical protein
MPDMGSIGRWVLIFGLVIAGIGAIIMLAGRLGLPLGRLPGDIRFESRNISCFIPLATSLVLSLLLTLLLNLLARWVGR